MTPQEFNDKVQSQLTVSVKLTITAFTKGKDQLAALKYILHELEARLRTETREVEQWSTWEDIWITERTVDKVESSGLRTPVKMVVAEKPEGSE